SHTDVIADKISEGMNIRDSIAMSLLVMDYEKDDYNTPRIAGASSLNGESYIGIVTHESLIVEKVEPGKTCYISTYEHINPQEVNFNAKNAQDAAEFIMNKGKFEEFTNPVTSAAAFGVSDWEISYI
ncbi:MAG: IMP cyclohydrolase, partial [Methanobacteriaceae archaeon]|nr:IMP cyclohydrolase [Methanobacteriaceae archaeon]